MDLLKEQKLIYSVSVKWRPFLLGKNTLIYNSRGKGKPYMFNLPAKCVLINQKYSLIVSLAQTLFLLTNTFMWYISNAVMTIEISSLSQEFNNTSRVHIMSCNNIELSRKSCRQCEHPSVSLSGTDLQQRWQYVIDGPSVFLFNRQGAACVFS